MKLMFQHTEYAIIIQNIILLNCATCWIVKPWLAEASLLESTWSIAT